MRRDFSSMSPAIPGKRPSLRQLKPFEAVQLLLDAAFEVLARAATRTSADPAPFLQQQFLPLAIGLEIERGDNVVADQNRQREIAEAPLFLGEIGLEAMFVIEKQVCPPALDDQRIERRENVHQFRSALARRLQRGGARPVR